MNAVFDDVSRRQFILSGLATGGVLVLGVAENAEAGAASATPWQTPATAGSVEFTPWISIAPDDTVLVRVATPDIGNGVITQACAFVMEELGCAWEKIKPEYASTTRDYLNDDVYSKVSGRVSYFSGRSTAPERMDTYMRVAASARERLKLAAAQQWGVRAADVVAENGRLTHASSGRSMRFGEALPRAARVRLDKEPAPKDRSQWTFLGKQSPAKVQIPAIVNGSAVFGIDVRVPNMVYAALRQAPVHGGTLKGFDAAKVKNMPGVLAVVAVTPRDTTNSQMQAPFTIGTSRAAQGVAVIAEHYWQARTALDALPVEWDDGPGVRWQTTEQMTQALLQAAQRTTGGNPEKSVGDVAGSFGKDSKVVEGLYHTPYCEHSCMEPLNGTAFVDKDRVEVWHPTQHSKQAFMVAADEAGMPLSKVRFHQTYVGGGFGRRAFGDDVRTVVAVARQFPGRPVQVIWSREETKRQGRFRPAMALKVRASLGADGLPEALIARVAGGPGMSLSGLRDTALMSVIPNVQIESEVVPFHLMSGPYRGPGFNSNAFMLETFVDECAHVAGIDPLEYRIKLYEKFKDIGWVKCLKELRDKSGWGQPLPEGQGRGVAISNWGMRDGGNAGTTVATVAKVEVSPDGVLKILQLDVAFDTGRILNEDAVRVELEGGTLYGFNMTLNEELTIRNGQVVEGNFDTYPMIRMVSSPRTIGVHLGGLSDAPRYNEIGEPPVGTVGPAIGNAIFAASGIRVRATPLRKQVLRST